MKFLVVLALVAVAAARPEYHDDVFHFSSLSGLESLRGLSQGQTVVKQVQVSQPRQLTYQTVAQPVQYTVQKVAQPVQVLQTLAAPAVTQIETRRIAQPVHLVHQSSASLAGGASYASAYNGPQYRILKQIQEIDPLGYYHYSYETENGIQVVENGQLTSAGPEGAAVAKEGSYSYTGDDGQVYTVTYTADENGFQASGAHLPTPPPIPAEILRSLEIIASQPQRPEDQK